MLWFRSEQSPPTVRLGRDACSFSGQVSLKTGVLDNYFSTEECNTLGLEKKCKTNEQNVKFNRKQGASIIQRLGSGVMFYLS